MSVIFGSLDKLRDYISRANNWLEVAVLTAGIRSLLRVNLLMLAYAVSGLLLAWLVGHSSIAVSLSWLLRCRFIPLHTWISRVGGLISSLKVILGRSPSHRWITCTIAAICSHRRIAWVNVHLYWWSHSNTPIS